jgi:hypothetical protein
VLLSLLENESVDGRLGRAGRDRCRHDWATGVATGSSR